MPSSDCPRPVSAWIRASRIDHINLAAALLRSGFMPFLALFLYKHGLGAASIGAVMAFGNLVLMVATVPAGMVVDSRHGRKVWPVIAGGLALGAFCILLHSHSMFASLCAVAMMSLSEAVITPALLAMNFNIIPMYQRLDQLGRNQAFGHLGRAAGLALAGLVGSGFGFSTLIAFEGVYLMLLLATVWRAPPVSRLRVHEGRPSANRSQTLLGLSIALGLFQIGNAALSLLLGLSLADSSRLSAPALSSGIAIVAQIAMIGGSILIVPVLRRWGYWRVFAATFAILPLRCVIATILPPHLALVPVEILHGIGESAQMLAIGAALSELRVPANGIGVRYGSIMLLQELGKAASPLLACYVAERWTTDTAYILMAAIGAIALIFWIPYRQQMPPSVPRRRLGLV
ncbi:MFS transporter [Sphingomonas nostoxanthinifaciens]|uniref:MFS transporter n=1 Tax=Sphingomonas nostoxanthinifaciens TaxID=2872652 RepID=UPI001CC1CF4A|nr:MFS transporter [Sphingomonas nostoxanthinifaciens]UAK23934.1 MFS transporter [Sphingomonas nostoxanthinifaciens]